MFKIAIAFLLIAQCLALPVFASQTPNQGVVLESADGSIDYKSGSFYRPHPAQSSHNDYYRIFFRDFKRDLSALKSLDDDFSSPMYEDMQVKKVRHKSKKYNLIEFKVKMNGIPRARAVYFERDHKIQGYLLVQRQLMGLHNDYPNEVFMQRVTDLFVQKTREIEALPLKVIAIKGTSYSVHLYTSKHHGYIEQYGIIELDGSKYLVLDAFYPDKFEKKYTKKVLESISKMAKSGSWFSGDPFNNSNSNDDKDSDDKDSKSNDKDSKSEDKDSKG